MSKMYWHNYDTGEDDYTEGPTTDEEALQYLPAIPAARNLYKLYREHFEHDINEAMVKVLSACIRERTE